MSHMTTNRETLVKARKAARMVFALLLLGGAVVFLYGIFTSYLPTSFNGVVLFAASVIPYIVSKMIEKKLEPLLN